MRTVRLNAWVMGLIAAVVAGAMGHRLAAQGRVPERPVVLIGTLSSAGRSALARLQAKPGVALVAPASVEVPGREELIAPARRAYATMDFGRMLVALKTAEQRLIDAQPPVAERVARLAELEAFFGACLFVSNDRPGAEERFAFARALAQAPIKLDPIFPPEAVAASATARSAPAVMVTFELAPAAARLWVDGGPAARSRSLSAGLHYVVVERADREPVARVLRVSKAAATVELGALHPATRGIAIAAADDPRTPDTERLLVSALLGAVVWRISAADEGFELSRYAALDLARPTQRWKLADAAAAESTLCAIDRCDAPLLLGAPAALPRPVWRRPWFLGFVGTAAAVVLGGIILGAVVSTQPRDYNAVVR